MTQSAQRPDIELRRKLKDGWYKSYCIIYFKPLKVWLFGKTIIDLSRKTKQLDEFIESEKIDENKI